MNSPTMKSEQLTPKLSPMSFCLDDQKNAGTFQNMLNSPTKLKLDTGSIGNSLLYPTSLSKLSELSRGGRSRQRRGSDTMRSVSPIRFQFFNNTPKMLKREYLSQTNNNLPLLSALLKNSKKPSKATTGDDQSLNSDPLNIEQNIIRQSIKDKLEQLRSSEQTARAQNENPKSTPVAAKEHTEEPPSQKPFEDSVSLPTTIHAAPSEKILDHVEPKLEDKENRAVSNGSAQCLHAEISELPGDINLDNFPTDKNGFVQYGPKSNNNNRYSFISSTSTDYEPEWYDGQQHISMHIPSMTNSTEEANSLEKSNLDIKIKQLELEITELKLQNEKLVHSMTTNRYIEERFMLEVMKDPSIQAQRSQRDIERKVKQLEKKFFSCKKVLKKLTESPTVVAASTSKTDGNSARIPCPKTRLARVSVLDLKKIEEQPDSSSGISSEEEHCVNEDAEANTYEDLNTVRAEESIPALSSATSVQSRESRGGFQLNLPVQVDKEGK
ncbi:mmr1p [Saccharomyces arboricola H-6]|uniref:Mmr1p n=1 Tax=Saccharomyces arboricola (strain H-6 / AS 2.3317 / CBS 10644) TaxID=1160507 RepID=J8PZ83_SACAR|nr:mmr1p [Saccharomyces arboricola H-6]